MNGRFRQALGAIALSAVAITSHGQVTVFQDRAAFESAVLVSAIDTFSDLDSQFVPTPLTRLVSPFSYSISAAAGGQSDFIYGLPSAPSSAPATWLTTNAVDSVVTFSGFAAGVNGIGGSFFSTTFIGDIWLYPDASLQVTATYASGSASKVLSLTTDTSFLGFVSDDQLLSLTVAAIQPPSGGPYWLTVSGLTLASLSPVPEVSPAALLLLGLSVLGWLGLRRDRAACSRFALWRKS